MRNRKIAIKEAVDRDALRAGHVVLQFFSCRIRLKCSECVKIVLAVRARADALAKEWRELDIRIQEANWQSELI